MYSDDALRARFTLRHHPRVIEMLEEWWNVTLRAMSSDEWRGLSKENYVELLCSMYKVLLDPFDLSEARESAEDDWEEDSKGEPMMGQDAFMDAM